MLRRSTLVMGLALSCLVAVACGSNDGGSNGGDAAVADADPNAPDADPNAPDADPNAPDARVQPNCTPGTTQCSDCIDNDGDGEIDGFDPECTSALDRDERSFATGIPGDNRDPYVQDCFFDGNSGGNAENDCILHTCCLLDNPGTPAIECPNDIRTHGNGFDPATCDDAQSTACKETCGPLAPPGCDCFGCCTICDGQGCVDVLLGSQCDYETSLRDPAKCATCFKNDQCGSGTPENPEVDCGGDTCILCPGQDPSTLPGTCSGGAECPAGETKCTSSDQCGAGNYCSTGCCIEIPG